MSEQELLYLMTLACVLPYQSQVQHQLLECAGSATNLFENRHKIKDLMPEATKRLSEAVSQMENHLARAEQEMKFAEKGHIQVIGHSDIRYPARLRECPDAPVLLYYRGSADLNSQHILSIVGTRKLTEYGRSFCQHFLRDLAELCPDVLVISGLAYGIDISAHRNALTYGLQTIGVLAHGLDQIYPRMHRQTAIEMIQHGGLLTEYMSQTTIDKINFVARNRIVAGISDATIVVESAEKGGSLITAGIAEDYNRDVFAVPGRISDRASAGCNKLIRNNCATLLQSADELVAMMRWITHKQKKQPIQRDLFPNLSPEESLVCQALTDTEGKQLNLLTVETNIPISRLSALLFELEMKGIVYPMSGGMYRLV